jgi:flagellar motor switch protein FliG
MSSVSIFQEIYSTLGRRDAMLLMSAMFFSGHEAKELFELLPDSVAEQLNGFADQLLEVPKKQRLSLLVREIRRMMSVRTQHRLEGVDPSWLLAGFRGEKPRVIGMVLMHMPSSITHQIVDRLPPAVRQALPPRSELRGVPMEVVRLVREQFDAKFALMEVPRDLKSFGFKEIVALEARELIQLTRSLGVEELACAFVSVGKRALAELLRRMPRENAEELIVAVKKVTKRDAMELKAAQKFLARVLVNFQNTDELFQKAGLYQLANAMMHEDRDFVRQVSQRFPRAHGRLLEEYLAKAKEFGAWEPERVHRLQDRILDQIKDLSGRGKISTRYIESSFRYHESRDQDA